MNIVKRPNADSVRCSRFNAIVVISILFLAGCGSQQIDDLGFGYERRGNYIYFADKLTGNSESGRIDEPSDAVRGAFRDSLGDGVVPCRHVDAATFEPLSEQYTRDKNKVYFKWISPGVFLVVELPGADPATFKPLNHKYAIDKNSIWFMDSIIPGSDPATATLLSDQVVKDKIGVYSNGEPSRHQSANTLKAAGSDYFVDETSVYWGEVVVKSADPKTFVVLGNSFVARDKNSVFRSGVKLPDIDAETCKFIFDHPYGYQVFSDKNGVYVSGRKFVDADPSGVAQIDEHMAKGNGKVFLVDESSHTPLTVYKDDARLMVEGLMFDWKTKKPVALAKAEVTSSGMKDLVFLPPPGETRVGEVQVSEKKRFQRDFIVQQILKAGTWLD